MPKSVKKATRRPYEIIKHLVGITDSGGQGLSRQTGEKFKKRLFRKRMSAPSL